MLACVHTNDACSEHADDTQRGALQIPLKWAVSRRVSSTLNLNKHLCIFIHKCMIETEGRN